MGAPLSHRHQPGSSLSPILLELYGGFITKARSISSPVVSPSPFSRCGGGAGDPQLLLEACRCPPRAASLLQRTLLSPQEVLGLQEPVSGPGGRGQCLFFIVLQLPCVFSHPSPPYILKLILFLVRTQQNLPMLS